MGACCNGKIMKQDNKEDEIYTKLNINQLLTEHKNMSMPKMDFDVENNNFNKILTNLIMKLSDYFDDVIIRKFCIEQLWNVSRLYLYDFTNSEYIVNDLREKNKKTENFLKKFKTVNYSIEELRIISDFNFVKFKRFLEFKNLVIILSEENLKTAQDNIEYILTKKINCNLLLFDNNLGESEFSSNNKFLLENMENKNFNDFPFIMLSLKFFPHLKSDNFIFFNYFNSNNFSKFFDFSENLFDFYTKFNVSTILVLNMSKDKSKSYKYSHKAKILHIDIPSIYELEIQKDQILQIFEILKYDLISNNSILFIVNETTDLEVLIYFIFLIVWKMTDIPLNKLKNYIIENFIFINKIKSFCNLNYTILEDFMIKTYDYFDDDILDMDNDMIELNFLKLVRQKLDYFLKKLKSELEKSLFEQVVTTHEKILRNIILNKDDEKFYKIKIDSQHFKNYISINENSLKIIELLGFTKIVINNTEYYSLSPETNISYLKAISIDFSNSIRKLL